MTQLTKCMPAEPMGHVGYGLHADFDVLLRKFDKDGNAVSEHMPVKGCPNLITDNGMNLFGMGPINNGSATGYFSSRCQVGTGTGTLSFSDTALFNRRAAAGSGGIGNRIAYWDTTNPKTLVLQFVYQFAVGAATGALTELGLSSADTGSLSTHAFFKDAFGDPTVVDVDSDEQVIVTYRLYITPSELDDVFVVTQNDVEYTITTRLGRAGSWTDGAVYECFSGLLSYTGASSSYYYTGASSGVGPVTSVPSGDVSVFQNFSAVYGAYTAGNFYRDDSCTISLNQAIANNIGAFRFDAVPFTVQIGISPRLNKTSNDTIKFTVRTSWARL